MNMGVLIALLISIYGGISSAEESDIRDALEKNAKQWNDFPDGHAVSLTKFAYIGKVMSTDGPIYVVETKQVLTGMAEPRGRSDILIFDKDRRFLADLRESDDWYPEPLWCADGFLYFAGRSKRLPANTAGKSYNGNALDLRNGWKYREMVDRAAEGSAFGNSLPSQAEREKERLNWDSK